MARCRRERVPPPSPDVARWRADGWAPLEPLHAALLSYESARGDLGDAAVDGPAGPVLDWPDGWDGWSLVQHRRLVVHHFHALREIEAEEQAASARSIGGRR